MILNSIFSTRLIAVRFQIPPTIFDQWENLGIKKKSDNILVLWSLLLLNKYGLLITDN
ncbi:hypothetical protein N0824_02797 [Microcystis sp. 0824]|nr:hypothetical protein N0824_02797 [Microcystis sp. 0824]